MCSALEYLHRQTPPIIHRDIKPQNIKVTSKGQVFLVDFGIAEGGERPDNERCVGYYAFRRRSSIPRAGTDARSDVYSLGATLYTLLTGQMPPDRHSLQGGEVNLVPLRKMNETISHVVQQAVLKAMESRRSDRPQTVDEFWRMLNAQSVVQEADTIHLTALKERTDARRNRDGPGKTQVIQRLIGVLRASPNSLRVIFLGAVSLSVLAVALALSLSKAQTPQVGDTAMPTIAISMSPGETATETDATATPLPVTIVAGSNTVLRSTPVPSLMPGWLVIASETARPRCGDAGSDGRDGDSADCHTSRLRQDGF